MSVIIRLQGLPWTASALDIRNFFTGLQIPAGGVHIIGGDKGDAFIAFSTDEDARQAMMKTYQNLNGAPVQLLLSSKTEMQIVIDAARTGQVPEQPVEPAPKAPAVEQPRQYDDPYSRGPSGQDARGGYSEEFQDPTQAMFGGEPIGYRDPLQNQPPWAEGQGRYPDGSCPPDTRPPFGGRDVARDGHPRDAFQRGGFPKDGPPRDSFRGDAPVPVDEFQRPRPTNDWFQRDGPPGKDGPPIDIRNKNLPDNRIQDTFPPNPPPDQLGMPYDRAPIGEIPFNRHQGPPFGSRSDSMGDVRPPQEQHRRPDQRGELRRGPEGRSEGRNGREQRDRDGRDGKEGRERESRDGRESRDRRDRSERDRVDRDRSDRDRPSRSDRDRSGRSDRRSERSERGSDRDRREHSESRRGEARESRESRDRPASDDKPNSDTRHSRDPPGRSLNEARGPPGRPRPDLIGTAQNLNEPPNQFPPSDPRHRSGDGLFPPRDSVRPRSRFDQERPPGDMPPGRFSGDDRRPHIAQDPDFRPNPSSRIPPDGVQGPPEGLRGPMDGSRRPPDGPRGQFDRSRGPMDGLRGPMDGPRGPMDGPRGPMDGPRGPMDGPRGPMDGPRGPMDGPRGPMDGPRGPMDGPRGPMDGPRGPMDGPRGPMDGPRGPMDGPRGPMDGPRDSFRGPMDDPRGPVDGLRDGYRGPIDGTRGRGPQVFPDQGNGFDRDTRLPDHDFRGGPPGDGFHQRKTMPPQGRGRPGESGSPGIGVHGMHDEGFPRGSDEGRNMNAHWDMERFPGGPPGRPTPRQDFGDNRQGLSTSVGKGLLGDAPGMMPPARSLVDRADMQMDHDGREANKRNFPPERSVPGQFGRSREIPDFGRGPENYEDMQRFQGRDMDARDAHPMMADDRGQHPMMQEDGGSRHMMPDEMRHADWGGPDGRRDGRWPDDRGPSRGRPMDRNDGGELAGQYTPRSRPPQMEENNRKRPRQAEAGNVYLRLKNLPFNVSYSMVRRFFIGCEIPYDGLKLVNDEHGKRNGTAYVRFMTEEVCYNALKRNGYDMLGRNVIVQRCSVAEFESVVDSFLPDEESEEGGADPPKRPRSDDPLEAEKSKSEPKTKSLSGTSLVVKVSNLPLNASLDEIRSQMTNVEIAGQGSALIMEYDSKGTFTGVAYVEVATSDNYGEAIGIDGKHMGSRILRACGSTKADLDKAKLSQPKVDATSVNTPKTPDTKPEIEMVQGDILGEFSYHCVVLTGLPPKSGYREVREFFNGLEVVQRGIQVSHDGSGNPTGEAYVEFSTKKDCKEAVTRDQNMMLQNKVTVKPILKTDMIHNLRNARNINSNPSAALSQNSPGITKPIPPGVLKRQWVYLRCSNLPLQVTIRELLAFFHKYNPVPESIRLHYTGDGNPTGNAVVGFPTKGEAATAMTDLNGTMCRRNSVVIANA